MKTFTQHFLIAIALLCFVNVISAQTNASSPDQLQLMNQFSGSWQCKISRDSLCIWEIKPFGKGFEGSVRHMTKGETYSEQKQLWGFDTENNKIYCYFLSTNGILRRYRGSFISDKKAAMEMLNITGDKILATAELNLVSPDEFKHTTTREGIGQKSIIFYRIKK